MSNQVNVKQLPMYIGAGVMSGVICWAGGFALPEDSLILKIYPGLILGAALFIVVTKEKLRPGVKTFLPLIILMAACVIGWRLAVDVGYRHGSPYRFATAGAVGALSVACGMAWVWQIRNSNALVRFVALITATGALGGWLFRVLHDETPTRLGDDLWTLLLFLEWQTILLLGIWLTRRVVKTGK